MTRQTRTATLVLAAAIAATGLIALAGDLNPPLGPVAPTMKTLTEVEPRTPITAVPFTIDQPGSYYLTANMTGVAGQPGVSITSSNVSLDLMGFTLQGVPGSGAGVFITGAVSDIRVHNGVVREWDGGGVIAAMASNCQFDTLRVNKNTGYGISAGFYNSVIRDCQATGNTNGFGVTDGGSVTACVARANTGHGFAIGANCVLTACSATSNGANGFTSGDAGGVYRDCAAIQNTGIGFRAGFGAIVDRCTARANGDDGFQAIEGVTVSNCTATENDGDGIQVGSDCRVTGNTCKDHVAGIHATGNDNRIDGNTVTGTIIGIGIDVDAGGNLIIANSASGNAPNYDITAGNITGTIVTTEAAMNAATNSNVNISF